MSFQASINIAQSNAYFLSDSLQGDVVLYTNASNQNFLFGSSNSNAYMKISKSNVIMTNNVTVGGNIQVPSIQFTVGGNIPTSQIVNIGNINGYNTASYGTSNVSTFSLGTSNTNDKFSFQAASNEIFKIQGNGTIFQNGQDIANIFTFRNRLLNGDMKIDQRNTGTSNNAPVGNSNQYTVDRWNILYNYTTGSLLYSQCNLSLSDPPYARAGLRRSLRILSGPTIPGSGGAVTTIIPRQIIEGSTIDDFILGTANANPMSLSFWFKSAIIGTHWFSIRNSGVNTQSYIRIFNISTSNTWENIQVQIPATSSNFTWNNDNNACLELAFDGYQTSLSSTITNSWLSGNFIMPTGGSNMWSINGFIEFTGVQLEEGNVCTPFEIRPSTSELLLCKRYYLTIPERNNTGLVAWSSGYQISTTTTRTFIQLPVQMRSNAIIVGFSNLGIHPAGTSLSISSIAIQFPSASTIMTDWTTSTGGNVGNPCINCTSTSGFLAINAELT